MSAAKELKTNPIIGTHSGVFHCDEALAVNLLRHLPEYRDAPLVRSRDPKVLEPLTIVVDVGGVYDDGKLRYDHHQKGFEENFGHGFVTKLSSAGLIYKHYGKEIIKTLVSEETAKNDSIIDLLYIKIYKSFVEAIDGIDNGIMQYDGEARYSSSTDLSARVGKMNPRWNEEADDNERDRRFAKASALAGSEFDECVRTLEQSWLPGQTVTKQVWEQRKSVHPSGRIMMSDIYVPFGSHIHDIEKEQNVPDDEKVLYILYKEGGSGTSWRILAVSEAPGSFVCRKALPEPWRGLRDAELDAAAHTKGAIFVHASGFTGGHTTKEGAYDMAVKALDA